MLMSDYTSKLLNLEDVIITGVENISEQLHIYIELPRGKHVCPVCGSVTDRIHDYRMQTIKDVPLLLDYSPDTRSNSSSSSVVSSLMMTAEDLTTVKMSFS